MTLAKDPMGKGAPGGLPSLDDRSGADEEGPRSEANAVCYPRKRRVSRPETEIDPSIVRDCLRLGSRDAWQCFLRHYQGLVYSVLSRRLGRGPHIDDLAQDTFIKACRGLSSFEVRGDIGLSAWIATIARNVAKDEARRRCMRSIATVDAELDRGHAPTMTDRAMAIRQALSELDEAACEAFLLRKCDGMSYREIARILNVAPNTARTLVIEAIKSLRHKLGTP